MKAADTRMSALRKLRSGAWAEPNLVHIHLLWLADREGHCLREQFSRECAGRFQWAAGGGEGEVRPIVSPDPQSGHRCCSSRGQGIREAERAAAGVVRT